MKRLIITFLIILILAIGVGCGSQQPEQAGQTGQNTNNESADTQYDQDDMELSVTDIGFSLAGQNAFYEQLKLDIQSECESMSYQAKIKTATTAEEQIAQINTMLSTGVSVIVIDPVDVDKLEKILAECETNHVPVINIIDSINGLVSTLISPDYISIGKSAGRDAVELYGDTAGMCMMIKATRDSFPMQLMTDGFVEAIGEDPEVTLVSEAYCSDDEENAYASVKEELSKPDSTVNFIFAQSDALGSGALRAIEELGKEVKLVVFGGDMTLVEAAAQGKVHSCIFFGPAALAEDAVYIADQFIKNDQYTPSQYQELRIEAAEGDKAAQYVKEGALYAEIIGE